MRKQNCRWCRGILSGRRLILSDDREVFKNIRFCCAICARNYELFGNQRYPDIIGGIDRRVKKLERKIS